MHRFEIFAFTKWVTLEPGLAVIQVHWI